MPFCTKQRKIPFSEFSRFSETNEAWTVGKKYNDRFDVSFTTAVVIHGILVYGGLTNMDTHSVTATVHDARQNTLGKGNAVVTSDGPTNYTE